MDKAPRMLVAGRRHYARAAKNFPVAQALFALATFVAVYGKALAETPGTKLDFARQFRHRGGPQPFSGMPWRSARRLSYGRAHLRVSCFVRYLDPARFSLTVAARCRPGSIARAGTREPGLCL